MSGGIELNPYQVILKPLVTEKGTHFSERHNAYAFRVHNRANKFDIKNAVETIWSVRVVGVRTMNRKGKPRRHKMREGHTADWKKAVVKLHEDDKISFF